MRRREVGEYGNRRMEEMNKERKEGNEKRKRGGGKVSRKEGLFVFFPLFAH